MIRSIFKALFRSAIVITVIFIACSMVWVVASSAGPVPDDNVCTEAGLYCNAEALCKAYIYHMECDTNTPKASVTACENVLANYLAVSDKPMPSRYCSSEGTQVFDQAIDWISEHVDKLEGKCLLKWDNPDGGQFSTIFVYIDGESQFEITWDWHDGGNYIDVCFQAPCPIPESWTVDPSLILTCKNAHYQLIIDALINIGGVLPSCPLP